MKTKLELNIGWAESDDFNVLGEILKTDMAQFMKQKRDFDQFSCHQDFHVEITVQDLLKLSRFFDVNLGFDSIEITDI